MDAVTKQPVKGRKRGGGGRVGEMERDALISHGTPFLMQDRFMDCSDKSTVSIKSSYTNIVILTSFLLKLGSYLYEMLFNSNANYTF